MSDKRLKLLVKAAAVFLAVSVVFCVFAVYGNYKQKKYMEEQRLINETKLAEMQQPTLESANDSAVFSAEENNDEPDGEEVYSQSFREKKIVVLDAGHGKSSAEMTAEEKSAEGYEYNEETGGWGEWRHYKNGTFAQDCRGSGCTGLSPENASCWYPMENADRDTEPEINLSNAIAAQKYLEEMGYEVRMTRTSDGQNPSMNKRVSYCFPENNTTVEPDASAYICIHSNAGGGNGTSYISLEGPYTQDFIDDNYISNSNCMGELINSKIASAAGLSNNAAINSPYLILFNKCPVPIAYLEIGFFDNAGDLEILKSSCDEIGRAIAEGVDEYLRNN